MTLGEKIRLYRKNKGLSQEQLAERINVSRQAITKWERDGGIPELNNLIALSEAFEVSIDKLIEKEDTKESSQSQNDITQTKIAQGYYDIELSGWNDGEYNILIVNEDHDFIYFIKKEKNNEYAGAIRKKYITSITKLDRSVLSDVTKERIGRNYFNGKVVEIELAKREGILAGFFDFRDDDYQRVKLESITETHVYLEFERSLMVDEITKITELSST